MIDRIMYKNKDLVVLVYDHKSPITVVSDNGTALELALELLSPPKDLDNVILFEPPKRVKKEWIDDSHLEATVKINLAG